MSDSQSRLISTAGDLQFGYHSQPIGEINYLDYPLRSPFRDLLAQVELEKQFVHFHFLGFASTRFIAGCSLTYANSDITFFFYLFNRDTGELLKRGCRVNPHDNPVVSLNPDDGCSILSGNGMEVRFSSKMESLEKQLEITIDGEKILLMSFSEAASNFETLRLCTPTGANGWTYCQKVAGVPAKGKLLFKDETFDLEDIGAYAHHDFTAGFLRQDTFWNWACVMGKDVQGNAIGLNLSNGVNETGFSENVVWVDGQRELTGLIHFDYNQDDLMQPWKITSDTGLLELTFQPEGCYAARNTKSATPFDFQQLFGHFKGNLTLKNGTKLIIDEMSGFCERQYAVWWS